MTASIKPRISSPKIVVSESSPLGAIAVSLLETWKSSRTGVLMLAGSDRRAETIGALLHALAPECAPLVLPARDLLPYDSGRPNREITGRRASVLRRLAAGSARPLVLATADAVLQRVPPVSAWRGATLTLRPGSHLDPDDFREALEQAGYEVDPRVDEPGEFSIQGQTIDIFPAGALGPVRIAYEGNRVSSLSGYDAATQLTGAAVPELVLDPMDELIRSSGCTAEHSAVASLFDYLPGVRIVLESGAERRAAAFLEQVQEAFQGRRAIPALRGFNCTDIPPDRMYLTHAEWKTQVTQGNVLRLGAATDASATAIPAFCAEAVPGRALRAFLDEQRRLGRRIILAAHDDAELKLLEQRARRAGLQPSERFQTWEEAAASTGPGSLKVCFDAGFLLPSRRIAVIAAPDVLGSRAAQDVPFGASRWPPGGLQQGLRPGDVVIHLERGVGTLRGLEPVSNPEGTESEMVRLQFADGDLMLPVEQLALVWKYGSDAAVPLDRADGESWAKRHAPLDAELARVGQRLVAFSADQVRRAAPKLIPAAAEYERFVGRFRFYPTPDQANAVAEILSDLGSGRRMDRIVCGDVGYGKTEVALRAAAAAVLSGSQVAVAVPTTVLARQHVETFTRRFAGLGVTVGHLSRLVPASEQRAIRKGLADGSIQVVIGTHAIAAKGVRFKKLGLVVVDEEQRFGAQDKAKLGGLGSNAHVLTLTATPIPRTLQLALSGIRSVSILGSPPFRRLPVQTTTMAYDDETVRAALLHERRRGGQSFIVCPRIEDLDPWRERLARLVPELRHHVVHAKLPPKEIDDRMMAFAEGDGDVLLATDIIESGLDLPRANTILVWRPERFGLAQLHQLRGRVGRGGRRGYAYLITEPGAKLAAASKKRLQAIEQMAELGAGFRISRRDLDLRGGGELLGEDQSGHIKLVGPELYRHLLDRAMRRARGEPVPEDYVPELHLDIPAAIPRDYIQDDAVRLEVYDRIAKVDGVNAIDRLLEEVEDRFGPPPRPLDQLVALARIRESCRTARIARIDAGPRAVAITFRTGSAPDTIPAFEGCAPRWSDGRLILDLASTPEDRIGRVGQLVEHVSEAIGSQ